MEEQLIEKTESIEKNKVKIITSNQNDSVETVVSETATSDNTTSEKQEEKKEIVVEESKFKRRLRSIVSFLLKLISVCLLFYPWISDYVNRQVQDSVVNTYQEEVKNADASQKTALIKEAMEYNKTLVVGQVRLTEPFEESTIDTWPYVYEDMLSINGSDVMGSVKIPKINVSLPIYHGTKMAVLEKGVGHLKGSSMPIGGIDTHSVLTGHTGLTNAKLFTDLTEVEVGDLFFLYIMDEKLAYKVTNIWVVEPKDTDKLLVEKGKDLCTLVTCTPYGVNSHRLLVRGERTDYVEKEANKTTRSNPLHSEWMRAYLIAILIGLSIVYLILVITYIHKRIRRKNAGHSSH